MDNLYWNHKGAEQDKYEEMKAAGFQFTRKTETVFHSYYRYFNDGDFPGWARGDWRLCKYTHHKYGWDKELNDRGLEMQEQRVTEAILYEYGRFMKKGAK